MKPDSCSLIAGDCQGETRGRAKRGGEETQLRLNTTSAKLRRYRSSLRASSVKGTRDLKCAASDAKTARRAAGSRSSRLRTAPSRRPASSGTILDLAMYT